MGERALAVNMPSDMAKRTAARYRDERARDYELHRLPQDRWRVEDETIRDMLSGCPAGSRILDCPCGTGRFFQYFADRSFYVVALDFNAAMIDEARKKGCQPAVLKQGNIFAIDLPDGSVDVSLAIRIMNLIEEKDMQIALRELQRVSTRAVIFTLRITNVRQHGKYRAPQTLAAVESAILPGWSIDECRTIHRNDFCMVRLVR